MSVFIILSTEEGVLLLKNKRNNLQLPGGGIKMGESPLSALHREVQEETGFDITYCKDLKYVGRKRGNYFYQGSYSQVDVKLSKEHTDYCFYTDQDNLTRSAKKGINLCKR